MPLPPLQPISTSHFYMSGDVTIHDGAAIAPGAILQADPDGQIIIKAGACIGMGVILHANQGTLQVETGAILGAGVLVVGKGKIGANACIGAATTIWNASIAPNQIVPSGSLVGDTTRQVSEPQETAIASEESLNGRASSSPPATTADTSSSGSPPATADTSSSGDDSTDTPSASSTSDITPSPSAPETPGSLGAPVYGAANLNRLLGTLFPHHQSHKPPDPEE